jgi:hypothetical protein
MLDFLSSSVSFVTIYSRYMILIALALLQLSADRVQIAGNLEVTGSITSSQYGS